MKQVKLFSWNVQGRVETTLGRQADAVLEHEPDVIALQEVTAETLAGWQRRLLDAGYSVASTVDLAALPYPPPPYSTPPFPKPRGEVHDPIRRKYFNLTAARHPMVTLPGVSFSDPDEARFAFPEKYLATRVKLDGARIEIHNAHLPPGVTRGMIKVHAFDAIRRRVQAATRPAILCGDFNAPDAENDKGPVHSHGREWPEEIRRRWRSAELALFTMPGMRDVYRDTHEPGTPFPFSHQTGREPRLTSRRYDYIFASDDLQTDSCQYLSEWLTRDADRWRRSDHAPVEAVLALPGAPV